LRPKPLITPSWIMNHPVDDPVGIRIQLCIFTPMPTYRALVRGKFDRPTQATREKLLNAPGRGDDLTGQLFSPEGTLTYSHHLGGFSFRVTLDVAPGDDAARQAHEQAELMAMELLEREGVSLPRPHRQLDVHGRHPDQTPLRCHVRHRFRRTAGKRPRGVATTLKA
jgi:hypothetical protein